MNTCAEAQRLFETGQIDPDHCDVCRQLALALESRETDLERGIEAFARGGDLDAAVARAMRDVPQGAQRPAGFDRTFHYALIGAVAAAVLLFFGLSQLAPAPPPPPPDVAAAVDTGAIAGIEEQVAEAEELAWNALNAEEWHELAYELRDSAHVIEKAADPSLTPLLVRTWASVGRAAENANNPSPPFYDMHGGVVVNEGWFIAATFVNQDESLAAVIENADVLASIRYYVDRMKAGELPSRYTPYGAYDDLKARLAEIRPVSWDALPAEEWADIADELFEVGTTLETEGDLGNLMVRKLLFDVWVEAGRAAENANNPVAPHFGTAGGRTVVVGWYRAASLAATNDRYLADLEGDLLASVKYYRDMVENGELPDRYASDSDTVKPAPRPPVPPDAGEVEENLEDEASERSSQEWREVALDVRTQILTLEKTEIDEAVLFGLLIRCGQAADASKNPSPPLFDLVLSDKAPVNVCWYRAASLMEEHPSYKISDPDVNHQVEVYRQYIREGARPIRGLSNW